ncbi:MAG: hypothetical protein R3243_16950, partial [Arenibacter latericius]|nr:hypothetical protein [Arenibacter latericius]
QSVNVTAGFTKIGGNMDVNEIIHKTTLSTEEMVFVVEQCVKEKKDRVVDINLLKGLNSQDPFFQMRYQNQLMLLDQAYNKSCEYFFEKLRDDEKETEKAGN